MVEKGYLTDESVVEEKDKWYQTLTHILSSVILLSCRWWHQTVDMLDLSTPITVSDDTNCSEAIKIFSKEGIDQMPVTSKDGWELLLLLFVFVITC